MDDLEFVQRCVNGDSRAWNEFVEKYSRLIYNYIHSVLKSKGLTEVRLDSINDLFQEIHLLLVKDNFRKLRSFRAKNGCSLASWLRQVTLHCAIDYLRRIKPAVSLDQEDDNGFTLKDVLSDASFIDNEKLDREERLMQLEECIAALDTEDRYFLELHIGRDLDLEEMKDILRISRGAVDMRKSRIIDRLRECFKRKGLLLPAE